MILPAPIVHAKIGAPATNLERHSVGHDRICKIDIPAARTEILQSISEYRKHHTLAVLVTGFLTDLSGKRIDVRAKDRLHALLIEKAPELKVYRVDFKKSVQPMNNRFEYRFGVNMYDMANGERSFTAREKDDGTLDVAAAMIADAMWEKHADYLEEALTRFAYNATKFNFHLEELAKYATIAKPADQLHYVHPLSKFFHAYQLL